MLCLPSAPTQVRVSSEAKAAYLVRGTTWVGFDLPQTIYMKLVAAAQLELGGVMVRWHGGTAGGRLHLPTLLAAASFCLFVCVCVCGCTHAPSAAGCGFCCPRACCLPNLCPRALTPLFPSLLLRSCLI